MFHTAVTLLTSAWRMASLLTFSMPFSMPINATKKSQVSVDGFRTPSAVLLADRTRLCCLYLFIAVRYTLHSIDTFILRAIVKLRLLSMCSAL
eukprot:SAG31_NODE_3722_length_3949_cov_7.490130_2_plen_93_part_00